jgi:hypothetical protein
VVSLFVKHREEICSFVSNLWRGQCPALRCAVAPGPVVSARLGSIGAAGGQTAVDLSSTCF